MFFEERINGKFAILETARAEFFARIRLYSM
jgi:hypothetical protein